MGDLGAWLDGIGLGRHAALLRSNDIDFDVLPTLTETDLKELGLSLGDRRRLLQAIAALDRRSRLAFMFPTALFGDASGCISWIGVLQRHPDDIAP